MKSSLTATRLRLILVTIMLLIVVAATAGFVFAQKYLTDYATSISKLNADAQSGGKNLETLSSLEKQLLEDAGLIIRTRSIVADNSTYADQFLSDIGRIAQQSGVTITGIGFDAVDATTGTAPATTPQPATTTPGNPTDPAATPAPSTIVSTRAASAAAAASAV